MTSYNEAVIGYICAHDLFFFKKEKSNEQFNRAGPVKKKKTVRKPNISTISCLKREYRRAYYCSYRISQRFYFIFYFFANVLCGNFENKLLRVWRRLLHFARSRNRGILEGLAMIIIISALGSGTAGRQRQ